MPRRPINRMPAEQRAKQFAPFRALTGLEEALAAVERQAVPRPILSQDAGEELDRKLSFLEALLEEDLTAPAETPEDLRPGVPVHITWYSHGHIQRQSGLVARLDRLRRYLYWDRGEPVHFDDLLSLSVQGGEGLPQ